MKIAFITLLTFFIFPLCGQTIVGFWKNIDDEDGKPKSIIEVYEYKDKVYGRVVELLEAATIDICTKCKNERKNAPLKDMIILWDLVKNKDGKKAKKGKILDPKSGKIYDCKIELENANLLLVRGYIKSPIFGRSQEWIRVKR